MILVLVALVAVGIPNVYTGGPRGDSPENASEEVYDCWANGFDSGFAGKYDSDRASWCYENGDDAYNDVWDVGCKYGSHIEEECNDIRNNPVEIEDFSKLVGENNRSCYNAGFEDGETGKPFNKDRNSYCNEYDRRYEAGYQNGCETHTAESSCELLYKDKRFYCRDHPDVGGCVDFLHNATDIIAGDVSTLNCAPVNVTCSHEENPEKYCLNYNDPGFCKTVGDICDPEGFVRPEYPYCTSR